MRYFDLNEMKFEDWDGKPFEAIVFDNPYQYLWDSDELILRGEESPHNTIVCNHCGIWVDDNGLKWHHAYPVAKNLYPTNAEENFDATVGKLKNMLHKLGTMYKDCSECRDNAILERNALQKRVQELEAKLAEKS